MADGAGQGRDEHVGDFPRQSEGLTRRELVEIIDRASEGCAQSTRVKLRHVAETTDAVAVGWFHCGGVRCPASQAGRRNQQFQEAFDKAMAARFGRQVSAPSFVEHKPFVVEVTDA